MRGMSQCHVVYANPLKLFVGSDITPAGFGDDLTIENGWVLTPAPSRLLFWIPPWHRGRLWRPSNTAVIGRGAVRLDFRKFVHGSDWEQCEVV